MKPNGIWSVACTVNGQGLGIHVCKGIHGVRVVFHRIMSNDSESLELSAQRLFANDELSSICSIKTVDAICSRHAILHLGFGV